MKNKLRLLFFGFIGIILLTLLAYITQGERSLIFRIMMLIIIVYGIIITIIYRKKISVSMRRGKGSRVKFLESIAILFFGISLYVMLLSFDISFDWTSQKLFHLTPQTKTLVKDLDKDLKIKIFSYPDQDPQLNSAIQYAERMAKRYESLNPNKVQFEIIDPVRHKSIAEQYNVSQNGTIIFEMNDKLEFVLPNLLINVISENEIEYKGETIFSAIIDKLYKNEETVIYYLTGNGELDFNSEGAVGYSRITQALKDRRYTVKALNLNHHLSVPEDADIVIIADPKVTFSSAVFGSLDKYIKGEGSVFYLLSSTTSPDINPLLMEAGFVFIPNIAIDPSLVAKNSSEFSIIPNLSPRSEITSQLNKNRLSVVFPSSSIITTLTTNYLNQEYIYDLYPLARMSSMGFGETDVKSGSIKKDDTDITGITTLAIASIIANKENPEIQRRAVAIGSLDFIDNSRINFGGNAQLFLNSIDFLLRNDLKTTIPPKKSDLNVSIANPTQARLLSSIAGIWVIVWIIFAIVFLIRRQNKVKEIQNVSRETNLDSDKK